MEPRYLENLRKRVILVVAGIIASYFGIIPLGILYRMFESFSESDPVESYFFFSSIRIGIMALFLYLALVHTKPSLVPKQKKYRGTVLFAILGTITIMILLPSGYVVPQIEQGGCITKSGSYNDDGVFRGMTSQGITTESECAENCILSGKFDTREEKICEFKGVLGKTYWTRTPSDFDTTAFDEIVK